MLIFNGCRIREFLNIKREDCHLDDRYFIVTESKTKSGRNRIVPISRRVIKFYRKTCATLLHSAEADSLTIKRILGHSTTDITEKHYLCVLLPDFHRAIDKI